MVRIIAGTLIDVGRGRIAPQEVLDILYAVDREKNPVSHGTGQRPYVYWNIEFFKKTRLGGEINGGYR